MGFIPFEKEKVMLVSDPSTGDPYEIERVVFGTKNGRFLAWNGAKTIEESEKIYYCKEWECAKELPVAEELATKTFTTDEVVELLYASLDATVTKKPTFRKVFQDQL